MRRSPWMHEELDALADLATTFFERECAPHEDRWCDQQHVDRDAWTKAGQKGLLCISIPTEFGGGGGDFTHEAVIARAQTHALAPSLGIAVRSVIVAHYLLAYGTPQQQEHWLPRLASGRV